MEGAYGVSLAAQTIVPVGSRRRAFDRFVLSSQSDGRCSDRAGHRIQQEALIWTTDYEGRIDGKSGDETIKAVKKFQARLGHPQTGTLSDDELVKLIKDGFAKRDAVGFQQLTDTKAGVSVGIPKKLLPGPTEKSWGKSWYSKQNGIAIDTLRVKDVSLRDLYDKLLKINDRTIAYQRFVDDNWFVIAAFEKNAAIYVRANLVHSSGQPDEIRGFLCG